jgi:predicted lactoylglutathione lyase
MAETRTFIGWLEYLDTKGRELTLSEFMAVMLMNTREYARITMEKVHDQKDATEHLEGMVGSLDEYMATNEVYQAIAAKRSRPVPALEAIRP